MPRYTSTMTISLPKNLKEFVKERSLTAHYGTPSDYIRGLIREDLKRLEEERLEQEMLKGLRSGTGLPITKDAWKRLKAEATRHIPLLLAAIQAEAKQRGGGKRIPLKEIEAEIQPVRQAKRRRHTA
jgi:antitoxin ParD1/3/4